MIEWVVQINKTINKTEVTMENNREQQIQRALAASDMYQLLSMFLHLPTEVIAEGLLAGSLEEDVLAIFQELGLSAGELENIKSRFSEIHQMNKSKEELLTEMRQEYTRLFTHPQKPEIAIYETLFRYNPETDEVRPSLFISPAAMDAERCYKKAGLTMSKEINEPADHMATEMEFMLFLYLQKAKALQDDDQEALNRREGEIKEFSELHLQRWGKAFFDRCMEASNSKVYKTFGEIGSAFIGKMLAS
jgi:TorA maturation chaperone TorD